MPAPIKFESVVGDEPIEITTLDGGSLSFGREADNNIVIDSEAVSRYHGIFFEAGSQWMFRDLGSSNGSWINGVQINEGQTRLLRGGDVVRMADFPVRVDDVAIEGGQESPSPMVSLLIFFGDRFESECEITNGDMAFTVGGANASLALDGEADATQQMSIQLVGERLELVASALASTPVIVNGLAIGGTTALADRDEVDIGPYSIIVNDIGTASDVTGLQLTPEGVGLDPDGQPIEAFNRGDAPARLRGFEEGGGWESESSRRRSQSAHRFVFGAGMGGGEIGMNTSTMPVVDPSGHSGFEMNASSRFSTVGGDSFGGDERSGAEKIIMIAGIIVFALVIGMILYLVQMQ